MQVVSHIIFMLRLNLTILGQATLSQLLTYSVLGPTRLPILGGRENERLLARATGRSVNVADCGGGMYACCTAGPFVCHHGQSMIASLAYMPNTVTSEIVERFWAYNWRKHCNAIASTGTSRFTVLNPSFNCTLGLFPKQHAFGKVALFS